ncbi:MAG: MBL fold metallo-hydrolase [Xanthomonadales bacterium]|nr:MBL fold metallo-hydrolase [Xanthomonadales bacterium]
MKIHQLSGYIQTIYLVEYDHGLLLLDGCCRCDVKIVLNFILDTLKRPVTDLKTVVVTHMHPDHAGGAHKLRKILGCQIITANKEHHWYKGFNGILMHWIDMLLSVYVGRKIKKGIKNVIYSRRLKADVQVKDGDQVPQFPEWQIMETPGHTDRDLSVWHQQSNQIYVADLFIKLRSRFICPFPIFHPNKYRASLYKVKQAKPNKVLLAHGGQLKMKNDDFNHLIQISPKIPRTPLRATIRKFKKITRRH